MVGERNRGVRTPSKLIIRLLIECVPFGESLLLGGFVIHKIVVFINTVACFGLIGPFLHNERLLFNYPTLVVRLDGRHLHLLQLLLRSLLFEGRCRGLQLWLLDHFFGYLRGSSYGFDLNLARVARQCDDFTLLDRFHLARLDDLLWLSVAHAVDTDRL